MRKPLLAGLALSLLTCAAALAEAPPGAPPPFGGPEAVPPRDLPAIGLAAGRYGPALDVIHTAEQIERLYRQQGKLREVAALYQDLLAKVKDPAVRTFAYSALARAEQPPGDPDKAIATLRQSLDENVQRLNQLPPPRGPEGGPDRAP